MDYKIGDRIQDDVRDLTIVNKKHFSQGNRKTWYYKYHCNKCGYECEDGYTKGILRKATWFSKQQLEKKTNCACCSSRITVPSINSIRATNPELSQYFLNDDDKKYKVFSNERITMKCPFCETVKENVSIYSLYRQGFSCKICSHSISMGERIVYALLSQLRVEFKKEYVYNVDGVKFRYDFFLPDAKTIIEVHGEQHYMIETSKYFKVNQNKIDETKEILALCDNIQNYIIIDARQSSFEYIKRSIENSELKNIIDLSFVDWDKIHTDLYTRSIAKDICEYWETHKDASYVDLENIFHFSEATLRKYIKLGISVGWCHNKVFSKHTGCNPVVYNNSIYFKSIRLCSKYSKTIIGKHYPESTVCYLLKRQGTKFEKITKQDFNRAYNEGKQCYGDPFDEQIL